MDELSAAFNQITNLINDKSSYFLKQYQEQKEEIFKLKKELSEKIFEDNNFNNKVSMIRTQAKEITELKNNLNIYEKRNNSLKEKNQELQKEIEELKKEPVKKQKT